MPINKKRLQLNHFFSQFKRQSYLTIFLLSFCGAGFSQGDNSSLSFYSKNSNQIVWKVPKSLKNSNRLSLLSPKEHQPASQNSLSLSSNKKYQTLLEDIKKSSPQKAQRAKRKTASKTKPKKDATVAVKKNRSPSLNVTNETVDSAVLRIEEKAPNSKSEKSSRDQTKYSCSEHFTDEYSPGYISIGYNCDPSETVCLAFFHIERNRCEGLDLVRYYCDPKAKELFSAEKIKCPKGCYFETVSGVCIK